MSRNTESCLTNDLPSSGPRRYVQSRAEDPKESEEFTSQVPDPDLTEAEHMPPKLFLWRKWIIADV